MPNGPTTKNKLDKVADKLHKAKDVTDIAKGFGVPGANEASKAEDLAIEGLGFFAKIKSLFKKK